MGVLDVVKIEAYIRHDVLGPLRQALAAEGLPSMSVAEAYGTVLDRRGRWAVRPRLRLEMVVQREDAEVALGLLAEHARTGRRGDGLVTVLPVEDAIRVRTTQRGREVLISHTGLDA